MIDPRLMLLKLAERPKCGELHRQIALLFRRSANAYCGAASASDRAVPLPVGRPSRSLGRCCRASEPRAFRRRNHPDRPRSARAEQPPCGLDCRAPRAARRENERPQTSDPGSGQVGSRLWPDRRVRGAGAKARNPCEPARSWVHARPPLGCDDWPATRGRHELRFVATQALLGKSPKFAIQLVGRLAQHVLEHIGVRRPAPHCRSISSSFALPYRSAHMTRI